MSETHDERQKRLIEELTERVNRLSGQVAALTACMAAMPGMDAVPSRQVCGTAQDMAAKKIGGDSIRTEPFDVAARHVRLIAEMSQAGAPGPQLPPPAPGAVIYLAE